ncbi:DUF3500 domain-containing protein [Phycicoccus sp. BSK3Z-2]|uniref:DUF3500 domain-containing protein n=1 Tax=Phycicoccus avicenniae TaxID=2828860 RepID=A0A941DA71_9MICO|nr:DUF3500 domain-containing protein [Phycicoccus avicenniae]MBR7744376.1 DUF3500 domain-containing protein [Phycicoccus avicenniae]
MADEAVVDDGAEGRREVAEAMAEAATAWLGTLTDDQLAAARGAGPSDDPTTDAERRRWFYTPTDHGGLTVHDQRPSQQRAAMRLVASGLSMAGYVTVSTIMGLENVLDRVEGFTAIFDRERGRDPGLYYLRVFGDPASGTWGWRFGGHHVSLNNLVVDGELVSTTPCFLGSDPARSPLLGGVVHGPLAAVEELGRELVRSMPPELRARAVLLDRPPADLVTANRTRVSDGDRPIPLAGIWRDERFPDDEQQARLQAMSDAIEEREAFEEPDEVAVEYTADPKGVAAADLDGAQREMLRVLLGTSFERVPEDVAPTLAWDEAWLDEVHVAWAGPLEPGQPHYYRLQAPGLLVEWDNTQRDANHAHSVWRDPDRDFGLDVLARHRAQHPH